MKRRFTDLAKYSYYGLLTLSFMTACGQDDEGVSSLKVTNGLEIDNSDYPSVVLLLLNGRSICTGTFINDSQLLTAAHCMEGLNGSRPDIQIVEPIKTGDGQVRYRNRARAQSFVRNDAYSIRDQNGVNSHDLAIVNFPSYSAPGIRQLASFAPELNQQITIVGYGNSRNYLDEYGRQTGEGAGVKRVGENYVAKRGEGLITFIGKSEGGDASEAGQWTASGSGDSGGPLFIRGQLAGITSGGGISQGDSGEFVSVSKYVDLNSEESQAFLAEHIN